MRSPRESSKRIKFSMISKRRAGSQVPLNDRFQTHLADFFLIFNFLPFVEMLVCAGKRADFAFNAIGNDDESVIPKELRDRVLIVPDVLLIGIAQVLVGSFNSIKTSGKPFKSRSGPAGACVARR